MGNTLYLEGSSGISGDMTVAALLDLGADQEVLKQVLSSLEIGGFSIKISRVKKAGLDVCDFHVLLDEAHENHDHDMEYLHGHGHTYTHSHGHETEHLHMHRGIQEIQEIIQKADMSRRAKEIASRIFEILADAEAKVHGVPKEQVHFHEVGAVDSIVDIISAAVCLDNLDITEVIVPELYEGTGFIRCQHGLIPVPVPAVLQIVEKHELVLHRTEIQGELVTPTGAAIVAAISTSRSLPAHFIIKKTGMGAGKRNYDCPGILRAMLIEEKKEEEQAPETDRICCLESNMDDCSGEALGYVMEKLFQAGARDVHYFPVYMKKNRPAYQLTVICDPEYAKEMEQIIFRETTTIGIRRCEMNRTILKRKSLTLDTEIGKARIKQCMLPNGEVRSYPEYQSVSGLAEESGYSFQEVYDLVKRTAMEQTQKRFL